MRFIEDAFVIIHIRLSHITVYKIQARSLVTFLLTILLAFGLYEFYKSLIDFRGFLDFIESALYLIFIVYLTFFWMTSWLKANRALNKAYGYEEKKEDDSKTAKSHNKKDEKDKDKKSD